MQHTNPPVNKEQLSQLMDGEWLELNSSECVKGVCGDEALRGKWARYHLIRDVINSEPVQTDNALVSRICAAIDDEPAYSNITHISSEAGSTVALSVDDKAESLANVSEPSGARESAHLLAGYRYDRFCSGGKCCCRDGCWHEHLATAESSAARVSGS